LFNSALFAEQGETDANKPQLSQAVPFELAKFAAEHCAKQFYGKMTFYSSTTYYDVNGLPSVYCIILVDPNIGKSEPNDVDSQIKHNHMQIKEIKAAINTVETENISGKKKAEKIAELHEQLREVRKKMTGAENFATFYCGATEDHVPVIRSHRGLPDHMTTLPDFEQEISSKSELSGMKLGKVLYLGVFDIAYELIPAPENGKSEQSPEISEKRFADKTKFIVLKSKQTITQAELKDNIKKSLMAQASDTENAKALKAKQEERRNVVQEKWTRLKRMYEQK
jgi:hypothetical protein